MTQNPHVTITKRATIAINSTITPNQLIAELQTLPQEWLDCPMSFSVSRDQRDGNATTIIIDAK